MRIRPYQKLLAWQISHELCLKIYSVTKKFPADERFGLVSQMRRSSASVATNIAEGNGKSSKKEQSHFLEIALTSLDELHYQTILSFDLSYISNEERDAVMELGNRAGYLIHRLRSSLR